MAKISACVITKNEAENIVRCLQSLKPIVNEIILVDTGSTDNTIEIARQWGAKVFEYIWNDDFAAARNFALDKATGDWIIFLDADEYIVENKVKNVHPLIERIHGNRKIESVMCIMENTEGINDSVFGSNPTMRIFRNSKAIRYVGRVHERICKYGKPTNYFEDTSRLIVIRHTGYTQQGMIDKLKRNTALLEADFNNGKLGDLTYYYLSDGYWRLGQYEKAVEFGKKALELHDADNSMFAHRPYVILLACMTKLPKYSQTEIDALCSQAMVRFSHHPEIYVYQARYHMASGRFPKALELFFLSIDVNAKFNDFSLCNEFTILAHTVYLSIARMLTMMNNESKALDYYIKYLQCDKYKKEVFKELILLIKNQKDTDIIYFLNSLYDVQNKRDIEFLLVSLFELKVKIISAYYNKIWVERFGGRELKGMLLLTNGFFEQAFHYFSAVFQNSKENNGELLAVVSLLLGGNEHWIGNLGPKLEMPFKKIILAYFQPDKRSELTERELPFYLRLCDAMLPLCNASQLENLLSIGRMFPVEGTAGLVADILARQRFFRPALEMYRFCMQQMVETEKKQAEFSYRTAICCYKLKEYEVAVSYFKKALTYGHRMEGVLSYLNWIVKQSNNENLVNDIALLVLHHRNL